MVSVEYFTVFVLVMSLCQKSQGACRCLHSQECHPPYTQCVSGCEYGFAGSKCQYANLLAYSSCQKKKAFVADGNYQTCKPLTGYLRCTNIDPSATSSTIRITHPSRALKDKYYVSDDGGWRIANLTSEVTNRTTEYSFRGEFRKKTFSLSLEQAAVCEIEVFQECTGSGLCSSECNCLNASDCLIGRPSCPSGCAPGYSNVDHGCQVCPNTTYGAGCSRPCGEGCQGGTCDHVDGRCNCKPGWEGRRCDTSCRNRMYGDGCSSLCADGCQEKCHHVDGSCRCKDGWKGHQCSTQCGRGRYGPGCTKTCGRNCINCHHVSGSCWSDCKSGHYGENCTDTCPPGFYGDGCKSECNKGCKPEKCNPTNGRCGSDCREGWTGENCIDECVPGTYGENCVFNCSEGCINQTCDRVSGRCEDCLEGWQHHDLNTFRCDKKCENGTYGKGCSLECSDNCKNQSCHHMVGACLYGCLDGRSGVYCETNETSDPGFRIAVPLMIIFLVLLLLSLYTVI